MLLSCGSVRCYYRRAVEVRFDAPELDLDQPPASQALAVVP